MDKSNIIGNIISAVVGGLIVLVFGLVIDKIKDDSAQEAQREEAAEDFYRDAGKFCIEWLMAIKSEADGDKYIDRFLMPTPPKSPYMRRSISNEMLSKFGASASGVIKSYKEYIDGSSRYASFRKLGFVPFAEKSPDEVHAEYLVSLLSFYRSVISYCSLLREHAR